MSKGKEIANWQGDLRVKKETKGMHPSAKYTGGRVSNGYEDKQKKRKKASKKNHKNGKIEVPDSEYKRKYEKPKYDKRESQIWY